MGTTSTVAEYAEVLKRSRLLSEADISKLCERFLSHHKGRPEDVSGFCKYLIQKKLLTEYQAALVQRGHAEGFKIGAYTIEDRIGKGQSAGVYRARHQSGQVVALKVLPASKSRAGNYLKRFLREGRMLLKLNHPNVVQAYEIGEDQGKHFIAMECVAGETLESLLQRRKQLPPVEAIRLGCQILDGLAHLHEQKMVHRDVKPANIMVTYHEGDQDTLHATIKILDVGIGRQFRNESEPETERLGLTDEGAVLGTPDYLSPEQARDARTIDIRADIYSVGCVLYHLLTGQPPFQEKTVLAIMLKHATEPPLPLRDFLSDVPNGLQELLDRFLAKKPDDRFATPAAAEAALHAFLPSDTIEAEVSQLLPDFQTYLKMESKSSMLNPSAVLKSKSITTNATRKPKPNPGQLTASQATKLPASKRLASSRAATVTTPSSVVTEPTDDDRFDVELVEPVSSQRTEIRNQPHGLLPQSRRDFGMLGTGAVVALAAVLLGWVLARVAQPGSNSAISPTTIPNDASSQQESTP